MYSNLIIIFVLSYLFGSIPTAFLIGKWVKNIDIRNYGSGNIGATNVFRTIGKKYGIIVLMLDMIKGFIPVFIASKMDLPFKNYILILVGVFAVIGHIWTIFLNFKGGKGVATSAGIFLCLVPLVILIDLVIFVLIVYLTHYVSAGSIIAAAMLPVLIYFVSIPYQPLLFYISLILSLIVIIKHKSNIIRILNKTENKFF